jgi:hypothetical protein
VTQYNEINYLVGVVPFVQDSHTIPQPSRDLLLDEKVNYQPNANHSYWVKYASQHGYVNNDDVTTSTALIAGVIDEQNNLNVQTVSGGFTWVASPTAVNQLTAQFETYNHDNVYPYGPTGCLGVSGVSGVSATCANANVSFGDGITAGFLNEFHDWHNLEKKVQVRDDFSKQIGPHSLKFGAELAEFPQYGGSFAYDSPDLTHFAASPDQIALNLNGQFPEGFKTPGIVQYIIASSGSLSPYNSYGAYYWAAYAQDDFKVSSRLTLNFGLRYDLNSMWNQSRWSNNLVYQALKKIAAADPTAPVANFATLPHTDKTEIEPRLGFAWDIGGNGRDVLRAGAGIYYDQGLITSIFSENVLTNLPIYNISLTFNTGTGPFAKYIYGVSPLPASVLAPTSLPAGESSMGAIFDPKFKDAHTDQIHVGYSHAFGRSSVLAVDYTRIIGLNGWRSLDINPVINGVRPVSALTGSVFGDPNLFGTVNVLSSVNKSLYDEVTAHFERRTGKLTFQVNYTLAWARGNGGTTERSTQAGTANFSGVSPQLPSAFGGDWNARWDWGPADFDERNRLVVAGVYELPFGVSISPSMTAASARPYTQVSAVNPDGDGYLELMCPSGNQNDIGFGVGKVPCGVNNARGNKTFVLNIRATKAFSFASEKKKLTIYGELYNITNRANFGNNYNPYAFAPGYNQPNNYIGGVGAVSTLPNSFQAQFGGRFVF